MQVSTAQLLRCCSSTQCRRSSQTVISPRRLRHAEHSHRSHGFPFPNHRNPTPHQIFHLPHGATQAQIKARYYDLVRLYHPDKAGLAGAGSADEAHARFQAITAAYDALRGKTPMHEGSARPNTDTRYQTTAAYRTMQRRRQELYNTGAVDDSGMDKILIGGVVATVAFVIFHTFTMRREAMADAASRSRTLSSDTSDRRRKETEDLEKLSLDAVQRANKPR